MHQHDAAIIWDEDGRKIEIGHHVCSHVLVYGRYTLVFTAGPKAIDAEASRVPVSRQILGVETAGAVWTLQVYLPVS